MTTPLRAVARLAVSADALTCVDLVQTSDVAPLVDKHTLMTADKSAANAALKELDILLTLQKQPASAHVVALHSFRLDQATQRLHVIMEHCARGDVFSVAQEESRLLSAQLLAPQRGLTTCERALRRIAHQTMRGLHALHAINVAHMDLSLENVFLTAKGDVRIGDLALAQRFSRDPLSGRVLRMAHAPQVAKPAYAAPELFATARPVQDVTKCDTWSLGVLLWHLLTRSPLFPTGAPTLEDPVLRSMIQSPTTWADRLLPRASQGLRDLLVGLLDLNPATRLSVEAALQHAWFARKPTAPSSSTFRKMHENAMAVPHKAIDTAKPTTSMGRGRRDRTASAEISLEATRVAIRPSLLPRGA